MPKESDLGFGFGGQENQSVDAAVIAVAERLDIGEIATIDKRHLVSCGPAM
ncbi:MAG: hypothetical protein WAL50_03605 [Kineosporiaceae bacterium]